MKITVDADKVLRAMQSEIGALIVEAIKQRVRAESAESELDVLKQLQAKAAEIAPKAQGS